MMFAARVINSFKRPFGSTQGKQRRRVSRTDIVAEQVKQVLANTDQKLILMVRS